MKLLACVLLAWLLWWWQREPKVNRLSWTEW